MSRLHLKATKDNGWSANAPRILEHGAIPFQTQVWMRLVQQLLCIYSSSTKKQQALQFNKRLILSLQILAER